MNSNFDIYFHQNSHGRGKKIQQIKSCFVGQQSVSINLLFNQTNVTAASFKIAHLLAKKK